MIHAGDIADGVVVVTASAVVQVTLGNQPIQRIPAEGVGFVVFVGQLLQTAIGVVAQAHAVAQGIGALFEAATGVVPLPLAP